MWKLIYTLAAIAIMVAFYQLKTDKPNVVITSVCVVIFMAAMMRLSAKTKSKNQQDDEDAN